jgi:hypothetical protein
VRGASGVERLSRLYFLWSSENKARQKTAAERGHHLDHPFRIVAGMRHRLLRLRVLVIVILGLLLARMCGVMQCITDKSLGCRLARLAAGVARSSDSVENGGITFGLQA